MTTEQIVLMIPVFMGLIGVFMALIGLAQAYLAKKVKDLTEHTNGMMTEIKAAKAEAANAAGQLQGRDDAQDRAAEVVRVAALTAPAPAPAPLAPALAPESTPIEIMKPIPTAHPHKRKP